MPGSPAFAVPLTVDLIEGSVNVIDSGSFDVTGSLDDIGNVIESLTFARGGSPALTVTQTVPG